MNILQECEGAKRVGISGTRQTGWGLRRLLPWLIFIFEKMPAGGHCDKGFPGKAGGYFHKDQGLF